MKFIEIFEKRDVVLSTMQRLEKYRGQKDVFVHFSSVQKIGVNPRTTYKTPAGVYAYPIDYVLSKSVKKLPYGNEFSFIFVIRAKDKILNLNEYTMQQYNLDKKKLYNYVVELIKNKNHPWSLEYYKNAVNAVKDSSKIKSPGGYLWYLMWVCSDHNPAIWNRILRYLGYNVVADYSEGIIHENEPTQAIFTTVKAFEVVEHFNNNDAKYLKTSKLYKWAEFNPQSFYDNFMKGKTYGQILQIKFAIFLSKINNFGNFIKTIYENDKELAEECIYEMVIQGFNPKDFEKIENLFYGIANKWTKMILIRRQDKDYIRYVNQQNDEEKLFFVDTVFDRYEDGRFDGTETSQMISQIKNPSEIVKQEIVKQEIDKRYKELTTIDYEKMWA
jgi:hypothetical protein